jgi:hypothetical protein
MSISPPVPVLLLVSIVSTVALSAAIATAELHQPI